MIYRELGQTGLRVSAIAFGAGPVAGLMTGFDTDTQLATVARAIEVGINWFDTAAGYGDGKSEENLGRILTELRPDAVHIATKVRVPYGSATSIQTHIRQSVEGSLRRLRIRHITLLQLHNGITGTQGEERASLSPSDVLGPVLAMFQQLRNEGLLQYLGLTGIGQPGAMREVIRSGAFDTLQVPFNILNPSAGIGRQIAHGEVDYGNILADCAEMKMGVFAIRVFAGGALLGQPPSAHTLKTPYFPLAQFERDVETARLLRNRVGDRLPLTELAIRFALSHAAISSAIIGFANPRQVEEVAQFDLSQELLFPLPSGRF